MIDLESNDLLENPTKNISYLDFCRAIHPFEGRDSTAILTFIVGYCFDERKRVISYEEAQAWALTQGCAYYEVNLTTSNNVVEVITAMVNGIRERDPELRRRGNRAHFKELLAKVFSRTRRLELGASLLISFLFLSLCFAFYLLFLMLLTP